MTERPTLPDGQDNEPCDNEMVPKYVREHIHRERTKRFSLAEVALLRECHGAGLTDVEASEKFREKGYSRSSATINSKRRRLKLFKPKMGRPIGAKTEHKKNLVLDEKEGISYWRTQRAGGDAFRQAMLAAGHQEYVDKTPGTLHARMVRAEPVLLSRDNTTLPESLTNEEARNVRDAHRLARRRANYAAARAKGGPDA